MARRVSGAAARHHGFVPPPPPPPTITAATAHSGRCAEFIRRGDRVSIPGASWRPGDGGGAVAFGRILERDAP